MANSIPESLRQILAEQYDADQLDKILAQVFQNGAMMICRPDGSLDVFPKFVLEVEILPPGENTWKKIDVGTQPQGWRDLIDNPPKEIEIAVFLGNFRQGAQGKHDEKTWKKDNFTPKDAPIRRGYAVTAGHRGGARPANKSSVLMALFRTPPSKRKYR